MRVNEGKINLTFDWSLYSQFLKYNNNKRNLVGTLCCLEASALLKLAWRLGLSAYCAALNDNGRQFKPLKQR